MKPSLQLNTADLALARGERERAKFEVGRALLFIAYSPHELTPRRRFSFGDVLRPVRRNGCGMGIDVRRERDGFTDMVWPEEVVLAFVRPAERRC